MDKNTDVEKVKMRELNTRFSVLALVLSGFNFLSQKTFERVVKDCRPSRSLLGTTLDSPPCFLPSYLPFDSVIDSVTDSVTGLVYYPFLMYIESF